MKLKQVLINILSNAIKFTDAPGSVIMTVERTAVFGDPIVVAELFHDARVLAAPESLFWILLRSLFGCLNVPF